MLKSNTTLNKSSFFMFLYLLPADSFSIYRIKVIPNKVCIIYEILDETCVKFHYMHALFRITLIL